MTDADSRHASLARAIESLFVAGSAVDRDAARAPVIELLGLLEAGEVRAARPVGDAWIVETWVKQGVLLAFRISDVVEMPAAGPLQFRDKDLLAPRGVAGMSDVRLVPGGSAVRRGAHVGRGAILMPPCYVNAGAFVGAGSMVDSHALVGSCAQVGARVHVSAAAQIGGVLEPAGAMPVIVEDDAFIGGLVGLFEGVRIGREAVIAAGVVLTASTPVYDLPRRRVLRADARGVLEIPPRAVVIDGARPLADAWASEHGISARAAIVVKDRDAGTDARAALEEALR